MAKRPVKARRVTTPTPPVPAAAPADRGLPPGISLVGVGASAGGLEAFTQLLQSLDPEAGLTVVLVQHLSPHHDSALVDLLRAHTSMPLTEVTNGVHIQPNHVYVIPPNVQMVLSGAALALSPRPDNRGAHTPIDNFFSSLAAVAGDQSIAVVLSGTASDGAIGIREVKAAGGITFAQTPTSAKFDGMPRAAIATGMVDVVMTPAEIGEELSQIARHPYARLPARADQHTIDEDQLQRVFALLRPASGVDFRQYKLPTVKRRLLRRMALHRISSVHQYVELLERSPEEVRGLFQDLLIHVTRFFREPESFEALAAEVFPKLLDGNDPDLPIRAWVCGCATGEEPYSLAIVLLEFLQQRQSTARIHIFATDVSETAIEHARSGVYPASIADDVGAERLRRFFMRSDGHYRVSKQIRDLCVFARQDLTRDPPFSRLDLVMCRNVLIYMNPVLQRKLIGLFHYALQPDGHLVLGQAESVGPQMGLFSLVDKRARIYRKKSDYGVARRETQPREYPVAPEMPRPPAGQPSMDPDRGNASRSQPLDPRSLFAGRRRGGFGSADCPGAWTDRRVPRTGPRRCQPEPAENVARGSALRRAERVPGGAQVQATGSPGGSAGAVWRWLAGGEGGGDAAIGHHPPALPRAVRRGEAARLSTATGAEGQRRQEKSRVSRVAKPSIFCSVNSTPAASTCRRSSRSSRPRTRSCNRRTKKSCRATRSCKAPTRSSTPRRKNCSRLTKSSIR